MSAPPVTTSSKPRPVPAPVRSAVASARSVAARAGVVLAPARSVLGWVSPLGWTVLALGLLAWVAGARYGWTELLMVAGAALVLFLVCLVLALGRAKVSIDAEVDPLRVTVGEPATGRIAVTNEGRTPVLPLLVELPVGMSAARFLLPSLTPGHTHDELFVVPTNRRGVIRVGPATTVQGDPLGLLRRQQTWTEQTELFVHPETVALEPLGAGLVRDLEGASTEDVSMSDLAFHALRDYQPGDDRRYIHWRSSAKANRLLVRQFLDTRRSHVAILLDPDPRMYRSGHGRQAHRAAERAERQMQDIAAAGAPFAADRDVETAISAGASIARRALLDEQDCTLVIGHLRATGTSPQAMLDTLARVEPGPTDLLSMSLALAESAPDASVLAIVTGPHRPFLEVQRAAAQLPPEVAKAVVVVDPDAERGIRHGGGMSILTLSTLTDLRLLLAAGVR